MAATPDIIPTDLTLEIGDNPTPERFMKAAHAFFGYVADMSRHVAGDGEPPRWVVVVKEGSALLAVAPSATATPLHRAVQKQAAKGMRVIAEDGVAAWKYGESALQHLTVLSEMTQGPKNQPARICLWVEHKPLQFDPTIAAKVREEEQLGYSDYGTVEGYLDTVSDKNGRLAFRVKDALLGITVQCYIDDERLSEAFGEFRHRVEVSGVIRYRKDGTPTSIRVDKMDRIPGDDELPSPEEVLGILRETA